MSLIGGLIQIRREGSGSSDLSLQASAVGSRLVQTNANTQLILDALARGGTTNKITAQTNMSFADQAVMKLFASISGSVDIRITSNPMISAMIPGGTLAPGEKLNIYEYRIIVQQIPTNSNMKEYDMVMDQINNLARDRWRIDKFMTGPQRLIFFLIRERL